MREYTVDMKNNNKSPDYVARIIWQHLFQVYRQYGDFDDMDSFLCDLGLITKRVYYANQYGRICTFYWFVSKGYTSLHDTSSGEEMVICSYDPNQMFINFKVLK